MKLLLLLILTISIKSSLSQKSSFVIIENNYKSLEDKIIVFDKKDDIFNEINIDTTKLSKGNWFIVRVLDGIGGVKNYSLSDSSQLRINNYKNSIKLAEYHSQIRVNFRYAKIISDSLIKTETPFFTYPNLSVSERYVVTFSGKHIIPNDNDSLSYDERRLLAYENYIDIEKNIRKELQELDSSNIWIYSIKPGHIRVNIFTDSNFELDRLQNFNMDYIFKPAIRPRLFDFNIYDIQ